MGNKMCAPCDPPRDHPQPGETASPVVAIVLAAGMSRRMGQPKMLLPFGDRPLLARVLESLAAAGIPDIVVVTGHGHEAVAAITAGFPDVRTVHNPRYEAGGMLSSVQAGVAAIAPGTSAFLVVLGDQPSLDPATVVALVGAFQASEAPVVAPVHDGKRGHPVLFSARCAEGILNLPETATLRDLVQNHMAELRAVPVPDPGIHTDIDTPEDYQRALRAWEARTLANAQNT